MHNNKSHGFTTFHYSLLASAILAATAPMAHGVEIDTGNPDWNVAPVSSPAAMNSVVAAEQLGEDVAHGGSFRSSRWR